MKKSIRILAMLLIAVLMFTAVMSSYAEMVDTAELRATANVTCGFTKKTGNSYQYWGKFYYNESSNLSINVYLYTSSGSLLSSCSNAGIGANISARKTVNLSTGTYIVKAYGYVNGSFVKQNETSISIP